MMKQFWKNALWAALLTAALTLQVGCGETQESSSSTASDSSISTTDDSTVQADSDGTTSSDGSYIYSVNDDGTISITGYAGTDTQLNIPSTVDGYVVSAIADHAFEANWDITMVTMPNGLTTIGESAFMDCTALTSITIPETVSDIRRAAFASCTSLTNITLPQSVTTVLEEAFTGCSSLTTLTVANASLVYDSWGLIESGNDISGLTIFCPSGSEIETWACENGIATQTLS